MTPASQEGNGQPHPGPRTTEGRTCLNRASAEALLAIRNDILDFSRIESGKLAIDRGAFDLRRLAEDTVELLAEHAHKKGLEVIPDFPADLPCNVAGDATRVRQILTNLVGNAIKFTTHGEVRIRIRPCASAGRTPGFRFEVRDTGMGIAPEAQARLFTPFTQADGSTTRRFGGTGLGLAISRQLVELMGGRIGLERKHDQGSLFWVELPMEPLPDPAPTEPSPAPPRPLRLLVVDDNAGTRDVLVQQAIHLGHRVEALRELLDRCGTVRHSPVSPPPKGTRLSLASPRASPTPPAPHSRSP